MDRNLSGCIVCIDLSPTKGHEQAKRRPALVISSNYFNSKCNMTWVVPISHREDKFPLHIKLPEGLKTDGNVLCEHIRSVDLEARGYEVIERLDDQEGKEFVNKIKKICCNCIM